MGAEAGAKPVAGSGQDTAAGGNGVTTPGADAPTPEAGLPRTLVWKLTKARTEALRASLVENPAAAADLLLAHLCERLFYATQFAGRDPLPFEAQIAPGHADFAAGTGGSDPARGSHGTPEPSAAQRVFFDALQSWRSRLPRTPGLLPACIAGLTADDRTALLGLLAAASLNAVSECNAGFHGRVSDEGVSRVATHVGCDVTRWWTSTAEGFFGGLTKAGIAAAVGEAFEQKYGKRPSVAIDVTGLKKEQAAARAESLVQGTGWLPSPVRCAHRPPEPPQDGDGGEPIKLPAAETTAVPEKLAA